MDSENNFNFSGMNNSFLKISNWKQHHVKQAQADFLILFYFKKKYVSIQTLQKIHKNTIAHTD